MEEFEKDSYIRGFQVYQDSWTPFLGYRASDLYVGNPRDRYAVTV